MEVHLSRGFGKSSPATSRPPLPRDATMPCQVTLPPARPLAASPLGSLGRGKERRNINQCRHRWSHWTYGKGEFPWQAELQALAMTW